MKGGRRNSRFPMSYNIPQLKRIPIASILKMRGIAVFKRSDTEMVCDCPLSSHTETDHKNKQSFSMGLNSKGEWKWLCHSTKCQQVGNHRGGDGFDLVARLDNLTNKEAIKRLAEMFACGKLDEVVTNGVNGDTHPPSKPLTNPPLAFELKKLDPDHPYIRERGISLETAVEYKIGFHAGKGSMANRVCFPLHENGALIGYAGRTVFEEEPTWKFPAGLHKTFLYGLEKCRPEKVLHLVESCWGVLWLNQQGVQAAALMGSSLTEAQEALLEPFAEIRVCMDNDEAGRTASQKIVERLRVRHKVSKAFLKG